MATNVLPDSVTERQWLPRRAIPASASTSARQATRHRDDVSGAPGEFFWDGAANTLFWVDPKHPDRHRAVLTSSSRPAMRG